MLKCILQTLGVPNVNRTTSQLYEYLEIVLSNKDISLLIIDDIQQIKFSRHSFEVFEFLRFLSEKFSVKFVCAGNEIPEFSSEVARYSRIQKVV
ncbi:MULTISPECIES: AAA family ATPase [Paenibacillus]|uniref:AAA family ATPase n=1 Tax=Paenibacillus TaxID=44249 RepID=UPI000A05305D